MREPGRCVTAKRKSSISSSQRTYFLLRCRFVLRHVIAWLSVRRSKSESDQQPAGRGAPATQQVVPEHAQRVYHRQQFEDLCRIVMLRHRQLAVFVRHRVLVPLVVWLREDRRDGDIARVCRQHRAAGWGEDAKHRSGREANFSASKLACVAGVHANRRTVWCENVSMPDKFDDYVQPFHSAHK